jgi:hypothetical protein
MKIDFKQFKKYTKIDKSEFVEIDVREMFADNIFNVGIADLKLAEKIFSSDDDTEFSDDEVNRVRHHAASLLPWFLAGLNDAMR